jgi:molybdopterin-guanine dinucleotide biosynthesis protein A
MQKHSAFILANYSENEQQGNKALLNVYGQTLLEVTFYKLREAFEKVTIIAGSQKQQAEYSKHLLNEEIITTIYPENGNLGAMLTALSFCKSEYAFFAGSNMPFLNKQVLQRITSKEGYDAVIPQHPNNTLEPVHALYNTQATAKAAELAVKDFKTEPKDMLVHMQNLFLIPTDSFKDIDPKLQSFFRVNSEIDLAIAKEKLTKKVFSSRLDKAQKIAQEISIDLETDNTIYFKVPGTEEEHEVIFDKRKNVWKCDCKHFSMKGTYCSHILAAQKKKNA